MEAVVSKSGGTSAVSIPQEYLSELGIAENDRVKISKRGSVITIEKVSECEKTDSANPKSLRNLIEERAGMDFEEYLKINPYSRETDNIESGTAGDEVI